MEFVGKHATLSQLSRYVDEALQAAERLRVEAHLRDCQRCRGEIAFMRKIGHAARDASVPRPPSNLLDRIVASRASGHRVILPAQIPAAPPRRRGLALGVIFLLLASGLAVGALGLLSRSARAGASALMFEFEVVDAAPRAVQVEYRGAFGLADEEQLKLRGRYRTASHLASSDDPGMPIDATLTRHPSGTHHTSISLPPSAVYAFFAVEDPDGRTLDTNVGRFWEILVTDEDGFPLFEALRQKFLALEERDWMKALETARQMTELYPDRAEGWWHRFSYERDMASGPALEELTDFHRSQLASLERTSLADALPDAQQLGALVEYARALRDDEAQRRLLDRLEQMAPQHAVAVKYRIAALIPRLWDRPAELLSALEEEWKHAGPAHELLVTTGYGVARRLDVPDAIRTWADRYVQYRPSVSVEVAVALAEIEGLRQEGMKRIRREIGHLDRAADDSRGIDTPTDRHRRAVLHQRGLLLAELGRALAAEGKRAAALDTLRLAVAGVWDDDVFRRAAATTLALGDTVAAIALYARIAADPLTRPETADSLREALQPAISGASWDALVTGATEELEERLLGAAQTRSLPPDMSLNDVSVEPVSLLELVSEKTAVLAYWTLSPQPTRLEMQRLQHAYETLAEAGASLFLVVRESATPFFDRMVRELDFTVPILVDERSELLGEVGNRLTRQYLVLDPAGRLHVHTRLEDAMRHAGLHSREAS